MRMALSIALAMFFSAQAGAQNTYNNNQKYKIIEVITYTGDSTILFRPQTMPIIPGCVANYFIIPPNFPLESRQQALSRLLTAYTTNELINIGFDGQVCGPNGHVLAYRIG